MAVQQSILGATILLFIAPRVHVSKFYHVQLEDSGSGSDNLGAVLEIDSNEAVIFEDNGSANPEGIKVIEESSSPHKENRVLEGTLSSESDDEDPFPQDPVIDPEHRKWIEENLELKDFDQDKKLDATKSLIQDLEMDSNRSI